MFDAVREAELEAEAATLSKELLELGVCQSCALLRTHYLDVNFEEMAKGFPGEYTDVKLDAFEEISCPYAAIFAAQLTPVPEAEGSAEAAGTAGREG